jgi:diguanylate cyclase (GGDEF)-like protein
LFSEHHLSGSAQHPQHVQVAIIGFGPSGAVAATMLGSRGIGTLAIDRQTEVYDKPRAIAIDHEILRRIAGGTKFAVCYADLDHFKEFNDRYSYNSGDRVIRLVANVLHDVVGGLCGTDGFVGHIGGDDFIFMVPLPWVAEVCGEIVSVFDELAPQQYSEPDRRAGYFFGKDRRGQLHRVPLMTLSIGVVTNERRTFTSAAQVSELATEMKSYAKTLSGSVYTVDRRQDGEPGPQATPRHDREREDGL